MASGSEAKNNESCNIWTKPSGGKRKEGESYQACWHPSIATTAPAFVLQVPTHGKSPDLVMAFCNIEEKKKERSSLMENTMNWARWTVGNVAETLNCSHPVPKRWCYKKHAFSVADVFGLCWISDNFTFSKTILSECPLHKSTEKTVKGTREKFAHIHGKPTPCHESQDVGQAVILCSSPSVPLLIFFLFYPKHLSNITQNNVYLFIPVLKDHSAVRQNVCFPEKSSCKGSCCFFKTPWSICITICAQFQYHLYFE